MSLLYVEENGAVVGINGGTLTVKKQTGEVLKIPKETVDGISLFIKYGIKGVAARRGEKSSTTKIINKIKGNKA